MPIILKHQTTGQVFTCMQVNHYQLAYYGIKYWDWEEDAERERAEFLEKQGISMEGAADWKLAEMEESMVKLGNVRLKNDPVSHLYWDGVNRPDVRK